MMRFVDALSGIPLERPPIWFMRQAGRYLPEYRALRERYSFGEAMRTPAVAAEVTLQPLRRFPLDAAIVFSDIMAPLDGLGVPVDFDPGPKLNALTLEQVLALPPFDPTQVAFVADTISRVRQAAGEDVAVIGFAGGPATLLAYLIEGSGSRQFAAFRRAMHSPLAEEALHTIAETTASYLEMQVEAGADAVQLFDSWAGLVSTTQFEDLVAPSARRALAGLGVPSIYFAPAASHFLDRLRLVGATAYGVDWRLPLHEAWDLVGPGTPLQGNLDPTLLLTDPDTVASATRQVLSSAGGRSGHIFNLGHGILPDTPLANVEAMVDAVLGWPDDDRKDDRSDST